MTTPEGTPETVGSPDWLTIDQAAEVLGVSAKTVRRRIKAGQLEAEKRYAEEVGGDRWFIDAAQIPQAQGSQSVVPVELFRELDDLHREITDAIARATKAETVAEFQAARRDELEAERDRLKAEANELRRQLEAERQRRWWQRRPQ